MSTPSQTVSAEWLELVTDHAGEYRVIRKQIAAPMSASEALTRQRLRLLS